jgi:anti-sigma factor RsiW
MSCSPFDLKDYFFGELPSTEKSAVEGHLGACPECREEIAALSETRIALLSVADEEPSRRIAFVSDKVFEPRWWQRLWTSGPQLGFVASAMLAAAIMVHGFAVRPATEQATVAPAAVGSGNTISMDRVDAEVSRRVQLEVAKAMAENEAKQTGQILETVNARLRQSDSQNRENLVLIREYLERLEKRNAVVVHRAMYE